MKKITNIVAPLLKQYRYRNKPDPFSLFNNLKTYNTSSDIDKGNVLILPLRVNPTSNTFEGVMGNALKLRGYKVHALMCGQSITACDNINQRQNFSLACSLCHYEQKRFANSFDINASSYEDEVAQSRQNQLQKIARETPLTDIFSYVHEKVSIGKYVEGGVARFLLSSNIDLNENETLIRDYFFTSLITVEATRNILKKTQPEFVLASHGIYSTWGAAMETCKVDGFHIIIWGRGYVGQGNIVASHNASYLFDTIHETSEFWENNVVSTQTKTALDNYFYNKQNPKAGTDHVNYYADIKEENTEIFSTLKLDKNRHRIGIYPNIPWDGKMFSATDEFPDMNVFVQAVLEWANKNQDVDLIIRAHPAEAFRKGNESIERFIDVVYMECESLPSNIIYIEPTASVNSYQLSKICDAALMYASTMALEFSYTGHPVIQVGLNNVSNKGIVFDAPTKALMFTYLDKAVQNKLTMPPEMQTRVVQYADYWINKRHIPEKLMKLSHLTFQEYTFKSNAELLAGHFDTLDWFIDRCIDSQPFIWESDA